MAASDSDICAHEEATLSPDGRWVALSYEWSVGGQIGSLPRFGGTALADVDCLLSDASACGMTGVLGPVTFTDPVWRTDGQGLFVVAGDRRTRAKWLEQLELGPNGWKVARAAPFGATAYDLQFSGAVAWNDAAAGAADISSAIRGVEALNAGVPLRLDWSEGRYLGAVVESRADLELIALPEGSAPRGLGVVAPYSSAPGLLRLADGRPALVDVGESLDLDGRSVRRWAYARPAKETTSGRVVGWFAVRDFKVDSEPAKPLLRQLWGVTSGEPDLVPLAVSLSFKAGRAIGLFRGLDQRLVIVAADANTGVVRKHEYGCATARTVHRSVALENWGTARRPLPIWRYRSNGNRGAIVYLHGGPGGSAQFTRLPPSIDRYLSGGFDVYVVEYSGGTGGGLDLTRRLHENPTTALDADARQIAQALKRLRGRYNLVGLHAESFGGALMLAEPLARSRDLDFVIAVAPWAMYRPPEDRTFVPLSAAQAQYQRKTDAAFLGDGRSLPGRGLAEWLERRRLRWAPDIPVLMIFAAGDDVSKPEDFPAFRQRTHLGEIVVLPNVTHDGSLEHPASISAVSAFLKARQLAVDVRPPRLRPRLWPLH